MLLIPSDSRCQNRAIYMRFNPLKWSVELSTRHGVAITQWTHTQASIDTVNSSTVSISWPSLTRIYPRVRCETWSRTDPSSDTLLHNPYRATPVQIQEWTSAIFTATRHQRRCSEPKSVSRDSHLVVIPPEDALWPREPVLHSNLKTLFFY